jgi:hypothetical protein
VRGRSQPIKIWSLDSKAVLKENWQAEVAPKEAAPAPAAVPVPS